VKMVLEVRERDGKGHGEIARVGRQLGIHPEALRTWIRQIEIDGGQRPGTTSEDARRIAELEREVRDLRRANEILKAASAYFAKELDPKLPRWSGSSIHTRAGSGWNRPARSWNSPPPHITRRRNAGGRRHGASGGMSG
jgi:transposase